MSCDGLLGQDSLISHGADVFTSRHTVSCRNCSFPTMTDSMPLLAVKAVDTSTVGLDSGPSLSPGRRNVRPLRPDRLLPLSLGTNTLALAQLSVFLGASVTLHLTVSSSLFLTS